MSAQSKFIVAIDAGHTQKYSGAISTSGKSEYSYNIKMSKILLDTLNQSDNIGAFIINPDGGSIKLNERTEVAMSEHADIFISIHHDSVQPQYLKTDTIKGKKIRYTTKYKGYSIFVSKKNDKFEKSFTLAQKIANEIKNSNFIPSLHHAEKIKGENRTLLNKKLGIYQFDDLIVLKSADIPSVLIECGIIVNPNEEEQIQNSNYHQKLSDAIYKAIEAYRKKIL